MAGFNSCGFSRDDSAVCTAGRTKCLRLWRLHADNMTEEDSRSFDGHERDVIASSFSPNRKLIAAGDRRVSVSFCFFLKAQTCLLC